LAVMANAGRLLRFDELTTIAVDNGAGLSMLPAATAEELP
jgi:hypothetical protein